MPVSTRAQQASEAGGQPWSSAAPASAPGHGVGGARREILTNHHYGLKEKMRTLTLFYKQHKQQLASSQGAGARSRRSIQYAVGDVGRDENGRNAEEDVGGKRHNAVVAPVSEAVVLRESMAPPEERAPAPPPKSNHAVVFSRPVDTIEKENVSHDGIAMSCPIKKAAPALPAPVARKLSLGGGMAARLKAIGEVGASNADAAGSRILVFVRLRPMSKKEKEAGSRSCVKIVNKKDVYLMEFASETDFLRLKRVRGRHFCFDSSFPDTTTQAEVYRTTTSDLVEGILQGRNGTVFCYGATGAGKTYTMLGTMESPGVMVLAIKDLFSKMRRRSHDGNHSIQLSYLEVYNETVRDLLSPGRPLLLREDKLASTTASEEVLKVTDSESDQAKQVLELQKENSELRQQLARQQQKLLTVQAQTLASNASPQQSPARSAQISTPCSTQRKVKCSILSGNCFNTPDSKRPAADNALVRDLQRKVKTMEAEIENMKKEHLLQLKQKDEFIRDLLNRKTSTDPEAATCERRVATRASVRKAQKDASAAGELKSPSHRFTSPAPTAKKRTFWDIGGNSPSTLAVNGRKTRSHVAAETPKGTSMLLQPGFARQRAIH